MAKRGRRPVPKTRISNRQRAILDALCRAKTAAQRLVERAAIVLMSSEAISDQELGKRLGVAGQTVERWRRRWAEQETRLAQAEEAGAADTDLKKLIESVLADRRRSGAPSRFTAEQVTDIIALACESPEDSGLPISHWTPKELAREAVKRELVESISPRHLDRFFKKPKFGHIKVSIGSRLPISETIPSNTTAMCRTSATPMQRHSLWQNAAGMWFAVMRRQVYRR